MASVAMVTKLTPAEPPIKITREVVAFSEDPNADPTLLL